VQRASRENKDRNVAVCFDGFDNVVHVVGCNQTSTNKEKVDQTFIRHINQSFALVNIGFVGIYQNSKRFDVLLLFLRYYFEN
jgi:hypothetical protein